MFFNIITDQISDSDHSESSSGFFSVSREGDVYTVYPMRLGP